MELHDNILSYLKDHIPNFKATGRGESKVFFCPSCIKKEPSAMFVAGTAKIQCNKCGFEGDILDIVHCLEDEKASWEEPKIYNYLQDQYNITLPKSQVDFYLRVYEGFEFDMVPLTRGQKIPFEQNWPNKEHKERQEWEKWIDNGLNIGVKAGKKSNITVIDVDTKVIPDVLKGVQTFIQETHKGYHFLFQYDPDLPSTRFDDLKIDLLNDGKQFVVYPSVVDNIPRKWNFTKLDIVEVPKIPEEVKAFFLKRVDKGTKEFNTTPEERIKESIKNDDLRGASLVAEGSRNVSLIKLGGVLRKSLTLNDTIHVLNVLNRNFVRPPLTRTELYNISRTLDRYINVDDNGLAARILDYLKYAEEGTSQDIEKAMGERKSHIDKALSLLIKEQTIVKRRRMFHLVQKAVWRDDFPSLNQSVPFKIPYFDDVAYFNWGDMILLGGEPKSGKTTISMNVLKGFVEQGIKPYYFCLESGSRFIKTACKLGLKEGDFWHTLQADPTKIEVDDNSVTIIDWLLIKDKAVTDTVMQYFVNQLFKTNSLLIIFMQLKKNGEWFAPNMVDQFPALAARYLYEKDTDGSVGYWAIDAIRDPRKHMKSGKIPCKYLWDEKKLVRVEDTEQLKQEKIEL